MGPTFARYATFYDLLYEEKDYDGECDAIERAFDLAAAQRPKRILDVGCGTGGHVLRLSRRGYSVTGVDVAPEMIELAREKAVGADAPSRFVVGDMRDFDLDEEFDAAICMFAALGYLQENEDLDSALVTIRRHLVVGAPLVFDVWNGLAVLRILPEPRAKLVQRDSLRVLRLVRPELDAPAHVVRDHYRLFALEDDRVVDEVTEVHTMRFFFPLEISRFLAQAGFELLDLRPFPDEHGPVDETVWNIRVVARAVRCP